MSDAAGETSRSLDELIAILKKLQLGELSEEQHDILESKAIYAVSALRSLHNMASPVHRLPLEVLGLIFCELVWQLEPQESFIPDCLQIRTRRCQPIQIASMVSRQWREAALSFPGLWTTVYTCEDEQRISEIMERSKHMLLRIFVSSTPLLPRGVWPLPSLATRLLIPTINTIASHSHRIRELHLVDVTMETLNETNLAAVPFPKLECLTFVMEHPELVVTDDQPILPLKFIFNNGDAPLLKKVTLIRFWPFFDALKQFRGLTHLCIAFTRSLSSIGELMDVLRALPDLEEFCLAHVGLTRDSTSPHSNKVVLERLRVIGLGRWSHRFRVSDFLQYLVLPSDVELFIWGARTNFVSPALRTVMPCFVAPKENIRELRLTAPPPERHLRSTIPSLRASQSYTIVSNLSAFQLDGDFTVGTTLLSQVPTLLDLSCVRELWLGQKYREEPSLDEWRLFFSSVPALDTMVIAHRPSHPIISALSLSKNDTSDTLPCTNLRTLRILDRNLSLLRLSLFAEQRDRMGSRLDLCEILSSSPPIQPECPPNDVYDEPHYNENSSQNDSIVADLAALNDYANHVLYSPRHFSPFWDVLPSPVFDWLRRIWAKPCVYEN